MSGPLLRRIDAAASQPVPGVFLRLLAVVLFYGAVVHVGNMMGVSGTPWTSTPVHFRVLDVVLLAFDLVVGVGLWRKRATAVVAVVAGFVFLQIIPYTLLRRFFVRTPQDIATLNGMVAVEIALLLALVGILGVADRRIGPENEYSRNKK